MRFDHQKWKGSPKRGLLVHQQGTDFLFLLLDQAPSTCQGRSGLIAALSANFSRMYEELIPTKLKINWQATATNGPTSGLSPGSDSYWKALQPHRKLDQVYMRHQPQTLCAKMLLCLASIFGPCPLL
jgi:hypothetical protein